MKTCDKCKIDSDDCFTTEIGNPDNGGILLCNECAAHALFNLFELGTVTLEQVKKAIEE